MSVLCEEDYFGGSLDHLRAIRTATRTPLLRKDFIFDEYQIYESAAARADALLLIVAALDDETLTRLLSLAENELGMDALQVARRRGIGEVLGDEVVPAVAVGDADDLAAAAQLLDVLSQDDSHVDLNPW